VSGDGMSRTRSRHNFVHGYICEQQEGHCCRRRCTQGTHTFVARAEVGRKLAEKVVPATQAYYRKRIASGAFTTEALRCLKRRLARVVFHHLHTDHHNRIQPCQPAAD
jgi:hypothetical protein